MFGSCIRPVVAALAVISCATVFSANSWGAAGSAPVTVVNPPTSPAETSSVDERGRVPFQFSLASSSSCSNSGSPSCQVTFGVPSGHRLVIQHVSGLINFISEGAGPVLVQVNVDSLLFSSFNVTDIVVSEAAFDHPVLVYANAGQTVSLNVREVGTTISMAGTFSVSGYLLDCTIAPCSPMAP